MTTENEAPREVEEGKWYRVTLCDIDFEEDNFDPKKQRIKIHYIFKTVAQFQDKKPRIIKFCRGTNWVSLAGKEGLKFQGSKNQKVWDAFGVKEQFQKAWPGKPIDPTEESRTIIREIFNGKVALCQVKVINKDGKVYANYLDIKALPANEVKPSIVKKKTLVSAKAPY